MSRKLATITALFFAVTCDGDGNGGGPTTPEQIPNIAGLWSGTEAVEIEGSQCPPASVIEPGTRTDDIFNVTQNNRDIQIFQFANCIICQLAGTISSDGSFTASGMLAGHPTTLRLEGQVTGGRLTATATVNVVNCDFNAQYDLTRG